MTRSRAISAIQYALVLLGLGFMIVTPSIAAEQNRPRDNYLSADTHPAVPYHLDIAEESDGPGGPNLGHLLPKEPSEGDLGTKALGRLSEFLQMPETERTALLSVEVAKSPPDETLLGDVLNLRVAAALAFVLTMLTFMDRRCSARRSLSMRFYHDRELSKSACVAAFLCLALMGTWLVTRIEYLPGRGFYVVAPRAIGGDEPHYLVMINSLLLTHNLHVQTVYDDVHQGGPEAGILSRGTKLDRHTIAVNQRTGHRARGLLNGEIWERNPSPEFAPSPDVYEIPVHPAAFPILMATAVAPMRPRAREVEPDVGFVLMLISWLGVVATYFVGRQVGMGRGLAMLAASLLLIASPWLAYSRAYFPESAIGLALILGLWALMSDLPILAALAAGAGAIMKPPFAVVGVGFLVDELRTKRFKDAIKIALVLGIGSIGIFAHDFWLQRRFLPMSQFVHTLIDPIEGLLLYAPWTIFGFVACAVAFLKISDDARLERAMALPVYLYLLGVSSVGLGPGYCYGPRYWVAFLPWLALASVLAIRRAGPYLRVVAVAMVLFAVAVALPGAMRYPQLFQRPVLDAWRGFH